MENIKLNNGSTIFFVDSDENGEIVGSGFSEKIAERQFELQRALEIFFILNSPTIENDQKEMQGGMGFVL